MSTCLIACPAVAFFVDFFGGRLQASSADRVICLWLARLGAANSIWNLSSDKRQKAADSAESWSKFWFLSELVREQPPCGIRFCFSSLLPCLQEFTLACFLWQKMTLRSGLAYILQHQVAGIVLPLLVLPALGTSSRSERRGSSLVRQLGKVLGVAACFLCFPPSQIGHSQLSAGSFGDGLAVMSSPLEGAASLTSSPAVFVGTSSLAVANSAIFSILNRFAPHSHLLGFTLAHAAEIDLHSALPGQPDNPRNASHHLQRVLKRLAGTMLPQFAPRRHSWQGLPAQTDLNWFGFDAQVQDTLRRVGASASQVASELDSCTDHDEWAHSLLLIEDLMKHPGRGLVYGEGVQAIPKHVEDSILSGVQSAARMLSQKDREAARPFHGESAARLMGGLEGKRPAVSASDLPGLGVTPTPDAIPAPAFVLNEAASAFVESTGDNVIRPAHASQGPSSGKWLSTALASMIGLTTSTPRGRPAPAETEEDNAIGFVVQAFLITAAVLGLILGLSISVGGRGTLEALLGAPAPPQGEALEAANTVLASIKTGMRKGKNKKSKGKKRSSTAKADPPTVQPAAGTEQVGSGEQLAPEEAGPQTILNMFGALMGDTRSQLAAPGQEHAAHSPEQLTGAAEPIFAAEATPDSSRDTPPAPSTEPPSASSAREAAKDSAAAKRRRKRGSRRNSRPRASSFASASSTASSMGPGGNVDPCNVLVGRVLGENGHAVGPEAGWTKAGTGRSHSRSLGHDSDQEAADATEADAPSSLSGGVSQPSADTPSSDKTSKEPTETVKEPAETVQAVRSVPAASDGSDSRKQVDVQNTSDEGQLSAAASQDSPIALDTASPDQSPSKDTSVTSAESVQEAADNKPQSAEATKRGGLMSWEEIQAKRRAVEADAKAARELAAEKRAARDKARAAAARRTAHLVGLLSKQKDTELRGWLAVHSAAGDAAAASALQQLEAGAPLRAAVLRAGLLLETDLPAEPVQQPEQPAAAVTVPPSVQTPPKASVGLPVPAPAPAPVSEQPPVAAPKLEVPAAATEAPARAPGLTISTPGVHRAEDIATPVSLRLPPGLRALATDSQPALPGAAALNAMSPMSDSGGVGGLPINMGQPQNSVNSSSPQGPTGLGVFGSVPLDGYSIFGHAASAGGMAPGLSTSLSNSPAGQMSGMGLTTSSSLVPGDMGGLNDTWGNGGSSFGVSGGGGMSGGGLGLGGLGGFSSLLGMPLGGENSMSQGLPLTSLGQQGGLGVVGAPMGGMSQGLGGLGSGMYRANTDLSDDEEKREDEMLAGPLDFLDT